MIVRITGKFRDDASGLQWSITNYRTATNYAAALAAADAWNTAYMGICQGNVTALGYEISSIVIGDPTEFFPTSSLTTQNGLLGGISLPDAEAALLQGVGVFGNGGVSNWWLHGLSMNLIPTVDSINLAAPSIVALITASQTYFRQYRPVMSPGLLLPVVDPPAAFLYVNVNPTLHVRRLGRPFQSNGQTHRYRT